MNNGPKKPRRCAQAESKAEKAAQRAAKQKVEEAPAVEEAPKKRGLFGNGFRLPKKQEPSRWRRKLPTRIRRSKVGTMVSRVYVEKKPGFDGEAKQLKEELRSLLGVGALENLRMVNRYDVEGISDELFAQCVPTVFSEPQSDIATLEMPEANGVAVFAVEYLPGQFDQRADSASECIQLISQGERPEVRSAKVYMLEGALSDEDVAAIKHYVINPIEAREASLDVRETLHMEQPVPGMVETVDGFLELDEAGLAAFIATAAWPWTWPTSRSASSTSPKRGATPPSPKSR